MQQSTCKKCGHALRAEDLFCPSCGEKVLIAPSAPIDQKPTIKKKPKAPLTQIIVPILVVVGIVTVVLSVYLSNAKQQREDELKAKMEQEKAQAEQDDFLKSIDEQYSIIVKSIKEGRIDDALNTIKLFEKYDQLGYKNLETIKKDAQIAQLQDRLKSLPSSDIKGRLDVYRQLSDIDPSNATFKQRVAYYSDLDKKQQAKANSKLHLLSWHWGEEYDYVIAEGEVKNLTGQSIESVTALVTWYDSNGIIITSDDAFIEYDPLMPGQTSPFKVMARYNPEMKKASIRFKQLLGGELETYSEQ